MLEQVLMHLNNWFLVPGGIHEDTYTIEGGGITLPFLTNGQYFRVIGSVFNDGVYQYQPGGMNLTDESFTGAVWALAIPRAVLKITNEIDAWQEKNGAAAASPYQSESFGGYSYSMRAQSGESGAGWKDAFAGRLSDWRKL